MKSFYDQSSNFKFINKPGLSLQFSRISVFLLITLLSLILHLSQKNFLNWEILSLFYSVSILGLFHNLFFVFNLKKLFLNQYILVLSFAFDFLLVSILQIKSDLNISLFLFIYIILLFLVGFVFEKREAFLLTAWVSLLFSVNSIIGVQVKEISFLFNFILYNLSFFVVTWLSNLISLQLELQGISIQQVRALNHSIVDSMPEGIMILNDSLDIVTANPKAESLFQNSQLTGKSLHELIPSFKNEFIQLKEALLINSSVKEIEIPFKQENENILLKVKMLRIENQDSPFLLILEDVTEVKRLELILMHQQKLAAIGGLAAGVAHELGNPLAAVSANFQFLEPKIKIEDEVDKKLISNTHKEISRLGRLISEFKDFAKPEKVPVDLVQINDLLKEVIENIKSDKNQRPEMNFRLDIQDVPAIRGSKDKLIQVFLNIILNAYFATQDITKPEVSVSCRMVNLDVVIKIRDNGIGMSEETKKRLFEPFYTTKGQKGTGLGLAIVYKIIQAHNAKVIVESEKGHYTEFIFKFPTNI